MNYIWDGFVNGVEVGDFYEDINGDIWFGVENNGVYWYDGKVFQYFVQVDLFGVLILSIYRDWEDCFWLGGWGGLFCYDKGIFVYVIKDGLWE